MVHKLSIAERGGLDSEFGATLDTTALDFLGIFGIDNSIKRGNMELCTPEN